mmetsp:Transcript_54575/g.159331  ORF Transcript_54575/g.159331 Transcript_54575/m.159331 type:complete len:503 (+) Transcript_54575:83-1591(+)
MSSSFSSFTNFCGSFSAPVVQALRQYQTAKIVQLHDARLGTLYYGLVLLIVLFVVGYEILYCNDHFAKRDVSGTPFMNIQQPTLNACNPNREGCLSDFTPLTDLSYCSVFAGNSTLATPEERSPCVYMDHHSLVPNPSTSGRIFIPTRVDRRTEVRDCQPDADNNFTCGNEYRIVNQTGVNYVADIERYTLLIAHTYQRDAVSGNNNLLEGSYLECDRRHRTSRFIQTATRLIFGAEECPGGYWRRMIPCIAGGDCDSRGHRRQSSLVQAAATAGRGGAGNGRRASHHSSRSRRVALARGRWSALQAEEAAAPNQAGPPPADPAEAFAIPDGDVFSLAKLLQLAGVSLDGTTNLDDEPLRMAGMMLDIDVIYNNLHAFSSTFGNTQVEYWYKVAMRPLHQVKEEVVELTDANRRTIQNRHGIDIVVKVQGTFGFFSIMNFMLMLTTASAMLAVATVLTDKLAIYAMKDRGFYAGKKYEFADAHEDEERGEEEDKPSTAGDRT